MAYSSGYTSIPGHSSASRGIPAVVIAAALLLAAVLFLASAPQRQPATLQPSARSHIESGTCAGWSSDHLLGPPPCFRDPLQRLRRAFQDENCPAALASAEGAADVGVKIMKLVEGTPFVFFRGAAGLFFQNLHCENAQFVRGEDVPDVISMGDAHPENFGVLTLANKQHIWGVNDFDHAFVSPFTLDVARGATGFALYCVERGWKDCAGIAQSWTDGYTWVFEEGKTAEMVNNDRLIEGSKALTKIRGGDLVARTFEESRKRDEKDKLEKWLEKYIDVSKEKFHSTEELMPVPRKEIAEFQAGMQTYLFNGVPAMAFFLDGKFFDVLDVASKKGSGTGSIGLNRYYILVKGRITEHSFDHVILEMKEVRNSILEKYEDRDVPELLEAKRAYDGGQLAYPFANIFHGWLNFRNSSYIIRRKSPYKKAVELADLSRSEYDDYAYVAGVAQAHYHVLAGCKDLACALEDPASIDKDAFNAISKYLAGDSKFDAEVAQFAAEEVARETEQHDLLVRELGKKKYEKEPVRFLASA